MYIIKVFVIRLVPVYIYFTFVRQMHCKISSIYNLLSNFFVDISHILKQKPDLTDLLNLLADIDYEWHEIGLALRVEVRVLESCERSNEDNGRKLFKVINSWMTSMVNEISWKTIIAAIECPIVNHKTTAVKIRMFLAKPEVRSRYEHMTDISQTSTNRKNYCQLI